MELHEKKFESLSYRLPANIKRGEQLPFQNDLTTYTTPSGIEIERKGLVRDLGPYAKKGAPSIKELLTKDSEELPKGTT